jgi:prepilin-type N-terminal cleavage/methylation domain-containing protein
MNKKIPKFSFNKGFTLIEMVLTIVILGLVSAIAFPTFVNLNEESHAASASSTFQQFRTSYELAHIAWFAQGQGNTINIGDSTVAASTAGYAQAASSNVTGCQNLFADMLDFPPPTRSIFPLTPSPDEWGVWAFNSGGSPACLFMYMGDTTPFKYFWILPNTGTMNSFNV